MSEAENRHYAVIDPVKRKMTVTFRGNVIAESNEALILKEVGRSVYNPVYYFPKDALKVELNKLNGPSGFCPIKGQSTRWDLAEDPVGPYLAWSYESALPRAKKIDGHFAFNSALVTFISEPL